MRFDRRSFLHASAGFATLTGAGSLFARKPLKSMTDDVVPISDEERMARIEKARRLMVETRIDAVLLEPSSSLFYYWKTACTSPIRERSSSASRAPPSTARSPESMRSSPRLRLDLSQSICYVLVP